MQNVKVIEYMFFVETGGVLVISTMVFQFIVFKR